MAGYPYQLIRSSRKTLSLQVTKKLAVVVRAPKKLAQKHIDAFVEKHQSWIHSCLETQRRYNEAHPEPTLEQELVYRENAAAILPQRVAYFAALMGLSPAGVKITSAKTRFGSCSAKNSLCFSWRLMAYPQQAVDYVVVHELAHIVHKNHGPAFYRCVERILPDYKKRRELLKK